MDYHTIPTRIIVKPKKDAIFDPFATVVEIDDEAAGPFVRVSQPSAEHEGKCICIEGKDWPLVRDAIQKMLNVAQGLEADTLPPIAGNKPAARSDDRLD
jgi:hypothetical protein